MFGAFVEVVGIVLFFYFFLLILFFFEVMVDDDEESWLVVSFVVFVVIKVVFENLLYLLLIEIKCGMTDEYSGCRVAVAKLAGEYVKNVFGYDGDLEIEVLIKRLFEFFIDIDEVVLFVVWSVMGDVIVIILR